MASFDLNNSASEGSVGINYIAEAVEVIGGEVGTGEVTEPALGMSFPNGDDFAAFCHTYAYKTGFQLYVRSSILLPSYKAAGVARNKSGNKEPKFYMMSKIRLQCRKGGRVGSKNSSVTGCKAFMEARREEGVMIIKCCCLEHNHPLDPMNSRFMVGYREIGAYFKSRMMQNDAAGIPITSNFHALALEFGGEENLPFNRRDMRNCINLERRIDRISGDAQAVLNYFAELKKDDPDFFYAFDIDNDGRLSRLFWADARCRAMCKVFGDAVTFDTTFLSNRYAMYFAPFIGVNHHGSSICIAAALIVNQDAESFSWIFEKWLECMGEPPSVILTDQCKSIGKAVATVLPNTPHRLCLWHIMRNAGKNLGSLKEWNEIEKCLNVVVHDSLDEAEFNEAWAEMVLQFGLQKNAWIVEAYKIRRSWVPAYWRGTFCAGMSSTQRSEQSNRFFKMYVSVETGLRKFISQFELALKAKVEHEAEKNFETLERPSKPQYHLEVEEVFSNHYTNEKFKDFEEEASGLTYTNGVKVHSLGSCNLYEADEYVVEPIWRGSMKKKYEVSIDSVKGLFTCTCKLFEFKGILCRHILRGLVCEGIKCIPSRYILDRWRKDIVRGYEHIRVGYYDPEQSARVKKATEVKMLSAYIESLALHDDQTISIFKNYADNVVKKLHDYKGIERVSVGWGAVPKDLLVYSRRRLQVRELNQRHIVKNTPAPGGDITRDPIDKRKTGRATKVRQKTFKKKARVDPSAGPSHNRTRIGSQNTPVSVADLSRP